MYRSVLKRPVFRIMELIERIKNTLPASLAEDATLLVALSGGADSVCLLLALHELGYQVEALHCNFELRGVESDGDEAFCRRLCRAKGIALSVRHFRTRSYATRQGLSIEMAARRLRYEWFGEMCRQRGAAGVCVAHHRDDNIETLFLNLVRGTGLHGLTGMQTMSVQEGVVILRPLLEVSRSEIEDWLQQRDQKWCTDSTNLQEDAALRNLVRLRLMPLLENMNARARENLSGDIRRLEEAERLYDEAVSQALTSLVTADGSMDIARLKESVAPRTLLQEWLHPLGFNSKQISEIYEGLDGSSGSVWASPTHRLLRDRGRLLLQATMPPLSSDEQMMPLGGLFTALSGKRLLIRRQVVNPSTFVVPRDSSIACFDIEKLTFPLTIRPVREGDRMHPFGLDGTRLVSDMMTDKKLSLFEKERQLVVLSGEKIVWLVGQRVAADFEVDDHTRHVMTIHVL